MDPIWNCILQVCCDPLVNPGRREKAMALLLERQGGMDHADAVKYSPAVLKAIQPLIDVLQPFMQFISALARAADFKE